MRQKDWLILGGLGLGYLLLTKKAAATTEGAAVGGGFPDVLGTIGGAIQDAAAAITGIPNIGEKGLPLQTEQRVQLDTLKEAVKNVFQPKTTVTLTPTTTTARRIIITSAVQTSPTMQAVFSPIQAITPVQTAKIGFTGIGQIGSILPLATASSGVRLSSSQQLSAQRLGLSFAEYARLYA